MNEFEKTQQRMEYCNNQMGLILEGKLHLLKKGEKLIVPITDEQKQKDVFLFKYYDFHYRKCEKEINDMIYLDN